MNKILLFLIITFSSSVFSQRTFLCNEKKLPPKWEKLSGEKRKSFLENSSDQDLFGYFMYEVTHAKGDKPLFLAESIMNILKKRKLSIDKINLVRLMAHQAKILDVSPQKLERKDICLAINKINKNEKK